MTTTSLDRDAYNICSAEADSTLEDIIGESKLKEYKRHYEKIIQKHKKVYKEKRVREIKQGTLLLNKYETFYITALKKAQYFLEDIFFIKYSLGKDGKPIKIYKFQTMVSGADFMFNDLASTFGLDDKGNLRYDPRITKTGARMRKYWIDELPQFINWIRGDIKTVGIRPMGEKHWEEYSFKKKGLKIRPGLLGAQYAKKKNETFIECINNYINDYINNPIRTDIVYGSRAIYNIIFEGVRST